MQKYKQKSKQHNSNGQKTKINQLQHKKFTHADMLHSCGLRQPITVEYMGNKCQIYKPIHPKFPEKKKSQAMFKQQSCLKIAVRHNSDNSSSAIILLEDIVSGK